MLVSPDKVLDLEDLLLTYLVQESTTHLQRLNKVQHVSSGKGCFGPHYISSNLMSGQKDVIYDCFSDQLIHNYWFWVIYVSMLDTS